MNSQKTLLLTVDIGNTNIVLGVHDASGKVIHHWRVSSDLRRTEDEWAVLLRHLEHDDNAPQGQWCGAILCSVVPALTSPVRRAVERVHGVPTLVLTYESKMNIRNGYRNPREVGMDRLANAAGARDRYGVPVIVVDFGTATTLDIVTSKGVYIGGCILPGLDASAEALFRRTAQLPRLSVESAPPVLGQSTVESIQSGLFYGAVGAVDGLVERLWKETGEKGRVVATGGLAQWLAPHSKYIECADAELTLHGLWLLWGLNAGKAGGKGPLNTRRRPSRA